MTTKTWTVWVGGVEVTEYLVTHKVAQEIANIYIEDGYEEDVVVEQYTEEELAKLGEQQ